MRKTNHSRASGCHIQKACGEWLTTRNKIKILPQEIPCKKHPQALRYRQSSTASALILTQSPPPTQLKTCTKQSSILSFFKSSGTKATGDKGTHEPGHHSNIEQNELNRLDFEDVSPLACTGDPDLPLLITGEQSLHRSAVYKDAMVHSESGSEDDICLPNPKRKRSLIEMSSSKMYFCQEMIGIASNSDSKDNLYTYIDVPDNESQSADKVNNGGSNDMECNGLNNDAESDDIGRYSLSNNIESNRLNNDSLNVDTDSNEPKGADIDSDNFDQPMTSKSHYQQPRKERLQKNAIMYSTVSHSVDTLSDSCDGTHGYLDNSVGGSCVSPKNIASSIDTNKNNQSELFGSVDSNIHIAETNNHSEIGGKYSISMKQKSLQSDSLSLNWSQSDKVQQWDLIKESDNSSYPISDIEPRFKSVTNSFNNPRIYTGDEFQSKSGDSLDKCDSIYLNSEFTLCFQREKYDRKERQLLAMQPSSSYSSIEFSFENDSQY